MMKDALKSMIRREGEGKKGPRMTSESGEWHHFFVDSPINESKWNFKSKYGSEVKGSNNHIVRGLPKLLNPFRPRSLAEYLPFTGQCLLVCYSRTRVIRGGVLTVTVTAEC